MTISFYQAMSMNNNIPLLEIFFFFQSTDPVNELFVVIKNVALLTLDLNSVAIV